jgi:hypothetical protein
MGVAKFLAGADIFDRDSLVLYAVPKIRKTNESETTVLGVLFILPFLGTLLADNQSEDEHTNKKDKYAAQRQ